MGDVRSISGLRGNEQTKRIGPATPLIDATRVASGVREGRWDRGVITEGGSVKN